MGLSEDGDDNTKDTFENLCKDLNMDASAQSEAWQAVERITQNYTLEGDTLHWLACAVYVSCRSSLVPTVGRGMVKGNCVSLTRLLRSTTLSLIEFFKKMKKWSDMANLPQEFRDKIDRLERNFAVSTVIYKKFQPIFLDIFRNPDDDPPKPPRSRKQRRLPCSVSEMFNFCWTMFVQVKGNFPAISDDLVNSYHLLLCCIDWFYANALLSNRKDLLNPQFEGLPENFTSRDFKPSSTTTPCIIQLLCEKHEGLQIEAKGIKEHWWKPYIRKLFDRKEHGLKGKVENLTGILELGNFESNSKVIGSAYEEYLLSVGDFDERIFLGKDAAVEMGTPVKAGVSYVGELSERMQATRNLREHFEETNSLTPSTPLTGRRYLKEKETPVTPVSTATQSVSRLQTLLAGCQTCPSDSLCEIFSRCSRNPTEEIVQRVKDMGETFCTKYAQPAEEPLGASCSDFARRRLQLAEGLYYKSLENIMRNEQKRLQGRENQTMDFTNLLEQDILHRSLFACCLEIVIFSYNSQRIFPWIMEIFNLSAYHFYKVIEILIRAEEGLSRDVVKHLNLIEERILEGLAWKSESPLWDAIKQFSTMPSVEDVSLPNQIEREGAQARIQSPPAHPALRRVAGTGTVTRKDPLLSPTGPTASDRFSSPMPGTAKRKLFQAIPGSPPSGSALTQAGASGATSPMKTMIVDGGSAAAGGTQPKSQTLLAFQQTADGRQMLIPVQVISPPGQQGVSGIKVIAASQSSAQQSMKPSQPARPKRTGSMALFFRKVYHLASVRLRDLCERLEIDNDLRAKMWTCFEQCMIKHIDMMQDRHLDQLIMCAVYVMAKVTGQDRSFQDIMKAYRMQPQAQSHVYRSVLLNSRRRRASGDSDSSEKGTSGTNSPVNAEKDEKEKEKDKKRADKLSTIRSSSTMPNSQPPTPTRLAGTGSSFEFEDRGEDRGDLITFYNRVYVQKIKNFALRFSAMNISGDDAPPLSPLPVVRPLTQSPRRVSNKHSVYLSPIKNRPMSTITPQTKLLYCFNRSPAKDLRAINTMLRKNEGDQIVGKRRLPLNDDAPTDAMAKRHCMNTSPAIQKKLEQMLGDRQATNGTQ